MKKNLASLLLGLLVTVTFFSCNKDDEEISVEAGIIGQWTVESADVTVDGKSLETYVEEAIAQLKEQMGEYYTEEMEKEFEESFAAFDSEIESEFANTTIEFKEDKMAIVTDEDGTEEGTWSLSDKNLTVTFGGDSQTFEVRSMTRSRAALYFAFEEEGLESPLKVEVMMNLKK